jgi:hypothetical protein
MFEVMVSGVDRLIIPVMPGKAFDSPPERSGDKCAVAFGKKSEVCGPYFPFNGFWIFRRYRRVHDKGA